MSNRVDTTGSGLTAPLTATPKAHIAYLDGLRAIAVVSVLVRHAWGLSGSPRISLFGLNLQPIVVMFSSGVDLFFVLSGFLLARSFIRAKQTGLPAPSYRDYWRARIRRIGPPFWIVLVLVLLFMTPTFIPEARVFSFDGLITFLAHVPIMQSVYMPSFGAYSVETPFWTLTIEVIFYLTLPFIVRLFFGRRWIVFVPVLALIAVGWLYMVRYSLSPLVNFENNTINIYPPFDTSAVRFFLSHQFPAFLVDFAAGILAALAVTSKQHRLRDNRLFQKFTSPTAGLIIFVVGLVTLVAAMWILGSLSMRHGYSDPLQYMRTNRPSDLIYYYLETIPFGISYGLILCGLALGPNWLKAIFSFKPLAFIGVIGYSVYLLHMPTLYILGRYEWIATDGDPGTHFLKLFLFGAPLIILLSYGFYRAVERPSIAWSQQRRQRRSPDLPTIPTVDRHSQNGAVPTSSAQERLVDTPPIGEHDSIEQPAPAGRTGDPELTRTA